MKMPLRIAIAIVALAVGALPATALAHSHGHTHGNSQNAPGHHRNSGSGSSHTTHTTSSHNQAVQQCRQERATLGTATFKQTYGTNKNGKNAFGKCVSHRTKQNQSAQQSATTNAQETCRTERQSDPAAFKTKYGTNANKSNAFGKCVSQHARSSSQQTESQQVQAEVNAARQCRTEQQSDPTAFKAKYGTNGNKSNAFGKCVSQHAHQQEQQSGSGSGSTSG
jgi:hypothetical protein